MTYGISLQNANGNEVVGLGSALQVIGSHTQAMTSGGSGGAPYFANWENDSNSIFRCLGFSFDVGAVRCFVNRRGGGPLICSESSGSLSYDRIDLVSKMDPALQLNGYGMWVKNTQDDSYSFSDRYPILSVKAAKMIGPVYPSSPNRTFEIPSNINRIYIVCGNGPLASGSGGSGPFPALTYSTSLTRTSATTVTISRFASGITGVIPVPGANIPSTPQMVLFS